MELLILIAYMIYAGGLPPLGDSHSRAGWLERDNARASVWERPVQTYERRRINVSENEKKALCEIFRNIENAYSNNNAELMARALACVSNQVDNLQDELYFKLTNGLDGILYRRFLGGGQLHQFSSPAEFEHFARLHTRMALFLGENHFRRNLYNGKVQWIEYRTLEVLKQYLRFFRDGGKNDFAIAAQRLLGEWTEHIESNEGFIRRCAYYDVDETRPLIQQGKLTPEQVRFGEFMTVCHLIKCGYTPKWLDEFYDTDGLRLKELYDAIVKAYVSNQEGAMQQAMKRVRNYWRNTNQRPYFDYDWLLKMHYEESFLNDVGKRQFKSSVELERFLALNAKLAYFLCGCEYKMGASPSDLELWKLERGTFVALKKYVDKFHDGEERELEAIVQKYLDAWIVHIDSDQSFTRRIFDFYKGKPEGGSSVVRVFIEHGYTPKWLNESK